MFKAIYYKEWIKCRNLLALALLVAVGLIAYTFLNTSYVVRNDGVMRLWLSVLQNGFSVIPKFVGQFCVVVGLALSALQFSSEMVNKRLKLTLHLPRREQHILVALYSFGVVAVSAIYLLLIVVFGIGLAVFYPSEIVLEGLLSLVPSMLAGYAGYFFVAWVVVEPIWRRKVAYGVAALGAMSVFQYSASAFAYASAIPALVAMCGAAIMTAFFAAFRFKDGAQD